MTNPKATPETLADDNALWALASALHSNVPEDQRPMSWSDFSPEQIDRLRKAASAFLAALRSTAPQAGVRRWKHKKRGTTYTEIGRGRFQGTVDGMDCGDHEPVVLYRSDADGSLWCRTVEEFDDGRFEPLSAPAERLTGEAVAWQYRTLEGDAWQDWSVCSCEQYGRIQRTGKFGLFQAESRALYAAPALTAGTEREHLAHDSRVYFICESCEEHNPEGAVGPRSDIAVMPDGTWLCDGCYSDCDKSAYGLIASDVDDFEFPRFEDLPRPAPYDLALSAGPAASGADKQERKG